MLPAKELYPKYRIGGLHIPDGGIINCSKEIKAEAGWRGFWVGFSACTVRAIGANAIMFMAYEYAQE